ncbi:hypothetical protein BCF44_13183 [Kutzneria buriramensis]|uniref:Uncharacterized protein n=1 Tax=Kutzneria buriramensis TaxID=1045776 RepID=A0A3E0GV38_9PSEU|nr:hypothetical protein BCF44_13183 [Kutzneria buriramensis]
MTRELRAWVREQGSTARIARKDTELTIAWLLGYRRRHDPAGLIQVMWPPVAEPRL